MEYDITDRLQVGNIVNAILCVAHKRGYET